LGFLKLSDIFYLNYKDKDKNKIKRIVFDIIKSNGAKNKIIINDKFNLERITDFE